MKPHTLPVKRRPVSKGMFKRLSAVTNNRKQRVAATANPETDLEDGSSKISRALTIIFLIHIVAIGLIFVHQNFLDGRPGATGETARKLIPVAPSKPKQLDLPKIAAGDKTCLVSRGDNYARIAERLGVDEGKLRLLNQHVEIRPGVVLKVPAKEPQHIIATEPPEVTAIRQPVVAATPAVADGLVDAVDVRGAPRATVVKTTLPSREVAAKNTPATTKAASATIKPTPSTTTVAVKNELKPSTPAASGKSYTIQNGESIWKVASKFGVTPDALMKANGIKDAKKVRTGTSLVIP